MKKFAVAALLLLTIPLAQAQVLAPVPYRASALTNTPLTIKAAKGVLQNGKCANPNSVTVYVNFYDTANAVVVSSSTPTYTLPLLGTSVGELPGAYNFANAIKVAASTAVGGTGTPSSTLVCGFGFN